MAGEEDTCTLLVQGLSADISRDALELHIEDMTKVGVADVTYMAGKTEANVKLNKRIKFDSERHRTISGYDVKIVRMHTKRNVPVSTQSPVEKVPTQWSEYKAVEKVKVTVPTQKPVDSTVEDNVCLTTKASEGAHKTQSEAITEMIKYPAVKRDLLKILLSDWQSSVPDCSLKIVTEGIELKGTSGSVKQAKLNISEQVFSFKSQAIPNVDSQRARLLQSDKSQRKVQELFSNAKIQAVLSVRDDQLLLTATDSHQHSQASRILERNIHRSEIAVEDFLQEFLQSADFKQLIADLECNYTVAVEREMSSLVIDALGDCSDEVQKQVRDKLEDNAQHSDDIQLTEEEWKMLKKHHQAEVEAFGRKSAGTGSVQVTLTTTPSGKSVIQISGDARLLQDVKTDLKKCVQRIVHHTVKFSIPGLDTYMSEDSIVMSGIQSTCKSLIRVTSDDAENDEEEMEELATPKDTGNVRASKVMLEVKQGDLTTFQAGVLVNTPAGMKQDLAMRGQISKAFCSVGGPEMQQLYDEVSSDGEDVIVTPACGNLKCQHVIHMRIHRLRGDTYQQIEDQIYRCLQKASDLKSKSIAFPTIGCGRLGYDPVEVVQCFEHAVERHGSDDSCYISKVIIAAYGDEACQEFEWLLSASPSPAPASPSQTTAKGRSSEPRLLCISFHITALGQSHIDCTMKKIEESVTAYSAEENVPAQYLHKFSKQEIGDIKSLASEDVFIIIDTQTKCIHIVGAKHAVGKTAAEVAQKVQAIEERPNFVRQTKGQVAYLEGIAKEQVAIPGHWKSVKNLSDENAVRVPVDSAVAKAVEDMVQRTWRSDVVGLGVDARNLVHKTIKVTKVEQIENTQLYVPYGHARKEFCARAAKSSFPRVTSDSVQKDLLTLTLGVGVLDDQLIPEINEYFLFHGAPQEFIESILRQGIDNRLSGKGMFGKGAYFCESSTKADQYADKNKDNRAADPHYMFLVKVITGHSYIAKKSEWERLRPPCLSHGDERCTLCGANQFFDSVMGTHKIGDKGDAVQLLFREMITYEKKQSYPAYLITYNRK